MPRGNPTFDRRGKGPGGDVQGRRSRTGVDQVHIVNAAEIGGSSLPPADNTDAQEQGLYVEWSDLTLPSGYWEGQLLRVDADGTYTQPDATTIVLTAGATVRWNLTIWVILVCCASDELPPADPDDATAKGIESSYPLTGTGNTLPEGQFEGQVVTFDGGGSQFQPDGATPITIDPCSVYKWDNGASTWSLGDPTEMLRASNNLSDVDSAALARANLGVAADSECLLVENDLSDIDDPGNARTNLGVPATGDVLAVASNLSDVDSVSDARSNLSVPSKAEALLETNNLSDVGSAATSRTNLDVYSQAEVDALLGGTDAWGTMMRLPPSVEETFRMRNQFSSQWTNDPTSRVFQGGDPGPRAGGANWIRFQSAATEFSQLYTDFDTVGQRFFQERGTSSTEDPPWVVFGCHVSFEVVSNGAQWIGFGSNFATSTTALRYCRVFWTGSVWQFEVHEDGETLTSTTTWSSTPTTPDVTDELPMWFFIRWNGDGDFVCVIRDYDGNEFTSDEITPSWWATRTTNVVYSPYFAVFNGDEMNLSHYRIWDGGTCSGIAQPI